MCRGDPQNPPGAQAHAQYLLNAGAGEKDIIITPATINKSLEHLQRLGIVRELTSRKRNRVFSYAGYLEIMNQGTELPD